MPNTNRKEMQACTSYIVKACKTSAICREVNPGWHNVSGWLEWHPIQESMEQESQTLSQPFGIR